MSFREIYMECTHGNHYKYYKMVQFSETQWQATWGRIGTIMGTKVYPMSKFDQILRQKRNKGYDLRRKTYELKFRVTVRHDVNVITAIEQIMFPDEIEEASLIA